MIIPKWEDGFFPEKEYLLILEVTAETGLWYGLTESRFKFLYVFLAVK